MIVLLFQNINQLNEHPSGWNCHKERKNFDRDHEQRAIHFHNENSKIRP